MKLRKLMLCSLLGSGLIASSTLYAVSGRGVGSSSDSLFDCLEMGTRVSFSGLSNQVGQLTVDENGSLRVIKVSPEYIDLQVEGTSQVERIPLGAIHRVRYQAHDRR